MSYGLDTAMEVVSEFRTRNDKAIPRIYILTDGQLTDEDACYNRTRELEQLNVEVNSYGFGSDFAFETMKKVMGHSPGGMVKHIRNTNDILETFQRIVEVTSSIVTSDTKLELQFSEGVIPGDFFYHRPSPKIWPAAEFEQRQSPCFDIGNLEAKRRYIWAFETRLPDDVQQGFNIGNFNINFRQAGKKHHLSWPIPVPVGTGNTLGALNKEVNRILVSLEDLRDNSLEAQITAYEARIEICREEGRDPEYIKSMETILSKLRKGIRKEDIDESERKKADVVPITTILDS